MQLHPYKSTRAAFVLRPLVCPCPMAAPRVLAKCSTYFIRTSSSLASVMTSDIYILYIIYTCALRCMLIKHPRKPTARTGCCNSKALSTHGVHNVRIILYMPVYILCIHVYMYIYIYMIYMQKKVWSCDLWNVKFQVGVSVCLSARTGSQRRLCLALCQIGTRGNLRARAFYSWCA
jgi:hypothetical protein